MGRVAVRHAAMGRDAEWQDAMWRNATRRNVTRRIATDPRPAGSGTKVTNKPRFPLGLTMGKIPPSGYVRFLSFFVIFVIFCEYL